MFEQASLSSGLIKPRDQRSISPGEVSRVRDGFRRREMSATKQEQPRGTRSLFRRRKQLHLLAYTWSAVSLGSIHQRRCSVSSAIVYLEVTYNERHAATEGEETEYSQSMELMELSGREEEKQTRWFCVFVDLFFHKTSKRSYKRRERRTSVPKPAVSHDKPWFCCVTPNNL